MKRKVILLFLFCCYLSLLTKGQDSNIMNHQFLFDIGGNYNYFYSTRFIDSLVSNRESSSPYQNYAGYTINPASGIHFGFIYNYTLKYKYIIELEFLYNNRRYIYDCDTNKLKVYEKLHNPEYKDVIKYNVSTNNIEAEFNLGNKFKRLAFFAGTGFFLASYSSNKLTYINGTEKKQAEFSHNIFDGIYYFEIYPEIKACYSLSVKNFNPKLYLGINKSMQLSRIYYKKSIFLVYGIKLPLLNLKHNKYDNE